MSKINIKEIRERYLSSKEKEKEFKWTYCVRRPISYCVAIPFLRLGVSATSVTILWLIVAAIGCAILASGTYVNMVIGATLLEIAVILDCVDGHIARFTRTTLTGEILDRWVGEILLVSSMFATGIGLSNSSDPMIVGLIGFEIDRVIFVYLGLFGAFAALFTWTVRLHWRKIALKGSLGDYEHDHFMRKSKITFIMGNLFHYSGALTMVLVISAALHFLAVALILICVNYGAYLLATMGRIITKARSLDSGNIDK